MVAPVFLARADIHALQRCRLAEALPYLMSKLNCQAALISVLMMSGGLWAKARTGAGAQHQEGSESLLRIQMSHLYLHLLKVLLNPTQSSQKAAAMILQLLAGVEAMTFSLGIPPLLPTNPQAQQFPTTEPVLMSVMSCVPSAKATKVPDCASCASCTCVGGMLARQP